jgi:hypothetical protein
MAILVLSKIKHNKRSAIAQLSEHVEQNYNSKSLDKIKQHSSTTRRTSRTSRNIIYT